MKQDVKIWKGDRAKNPNNKILKGNITEVNAKRYNNMVR